MVRCGSICFSRSAAVSAAYVCGFCVIVMTTESREKHQMVCLHARCARIANQLPEILPVGNQLQRGRAPGIQRGQAFVRRWFKPQFDQYDSVSSRKGGAGILKIWGKSYPVYSTDFVCVILFRRNFGPEVRRKETGSICGDPSANSDHRRLYRMTSAKNGSHCHFRNMRYGSGPRDRRPTR